MPEKHTDQLPQDWKAMDVFFFCFFFSLNKINFHLLEISFNRALGKS